MFVNESIHRDSGQKKKFNWGLKKPENKIEWIQLLLGNRTIESVTAKEDLGKLFIFLNWIKIDSDCQRIIK